MAKRGRFTLSRLNAHRVVLAAALTTLVAAARATTLLVFSGQALPRSVHQRGVACALALPALTAPVLNLSVFTGSSAPVPIAPDLVGLAAPAAGLAVLAAVAVITETRLLRRRGVSSLLRIGG